MTAVAADEVPPPGNPIAIGFITGHPDVARSGARRNVGRRSAYMKPKFGRLGSCCAHAQSCGHHRCSQHPVPHAVHTPLHLGPATGPPGFFCLRLRLRCLRGQAGYVLIEPGLSQRLRRQIENMFPQLSRKSGFSAPSSRPPRYPWGRMLKWSFTLNVHHLPARALHRNRRHRHERHRRNPAEPGNEGLRLRSAPRPGD